MKSKDIKIGTVYLIAAPNLGVYYRTSVKGRVTSVEKGTSVKGRVTSVEKGRAYFETLIADTVHYRDDKPVSHVLMTWEDWKAEETARKERAEAARAKRDAVFAASNAKHEEVINVLNSVFGLDLEQRRPGTIPSRVEIDKKDWDKIIALAEGN